MPRVELAFDDDTVFLEIEESRLLGVWEDPQGFRAPRFRELMRSALESPRDYPPLRQAMVPGDRVIIAFDVETPEAAIVLQEVATVLDASGVEEDDVKVLTAAPVSSAISDAAPAEWRWVRHDPSDRASLAYLASTANGRRVYLNRDLVDADFVLPIGRIGHDSIVGRRGPWSMLFPFLSDEESLRSIKPAANSSPLSSADGLNHLSREAAEVGWLLGSQFQIGVIPGRGGPSGILAGLAESVLNETDRVLNDVWTYRSTQRASLVIAGIQRPDGPTRIADIADGLTAAANLVQRGGRIALLSLANDQIGPALQRLLDREGSGESVARKLKGFEGESDYWAARRIAAAADWADVYLLSDFEPDVFEELAIISLSNSSQVRRLIESSESCVVLNYANGVRVTIAESDPDIVRLG